MNEPTTTFVGNLAADPELKFTPTGKAVANVAVVCNPRRFDSNTGSWIDGTPVFWSCEVWGEPGENAAASLHKGDRVLITGRVKAYVWTPSEGPNAATEQRRVQVVVEEIGACLRFANVRIVKADRDTPDAPGDGEPPF